MGFLLLLVGLTSLNLPPASDAVIQQHANSQAAFRQHEAQLTRTHMQAKAEADAAAKRAYAERVTRSTPSLPPPPKELCESRWFAC